MSRFHTVETKVRGVALGTLQTLPLVRCGCCSVAGDSVEWTSDSIWKQCQGLIPHWRCFGSLGLDDVGRRTKGHCRQSTGWSNDSQNRVRATSFKFSPLGSFLPSVVGHPHLPLVCPRCACHLLSPPPGSQNRRCLNFHWQSGKCSYPNAVVTNKCC